MPQQKKMPGAAREKRNCWMRGNGPYSFRGELKRGIALNKKYFGKVTQNAGGERQGPCYPCGRPCGDLCPCLGKVDKQKAA